MDDRLAFAQLYPLVASWYSQTSSLNPPVQTLADKKSDNGRIRLTPEILRRLLNGLYYSRELIASYYIVIGLLLLTLTIYHWTLILSASRYNARRNDSARRGLLEDISGTYGSLVTDGESIKTKEDPSKRTFSSNLLRMLKGTKHKTRAWLIYQPPPLPLVNKVLPPNETSLAVIVLIGINVFYTFYRVDFDINLTFVFTSRCGLLFVANLPLLYILAAKNQPIKFLTGHSYESLNIYHRRLGEFMCLLGFLHSAGMLVVYLMLRNRDFTLWDFLTNRVIALGLGAFICYDLLYATSLASFRHLCYELFLALHIILQLAALVLVFFHHSGSRIYLGVSLAIFCVDRLIFRMFLKPNTLQATTLVHMDNETVSLMIKTKVSSKYQRVRSIFQGIRGSWQPAEHVFVSVPALGGLHSLQAHPFTIASHAPNRLETTGELHLLIRAQDGFSRQLLQHAFHHPVIDVRVEGPYGTNSALELCQGGDVNILVAGGSGIAVVWPLACALRANTTESPSGSVGASGYSRRPAVVLIWVLREADHVEWIGQAALDEARRAGVEIIVPTPTETGGRPDLGSIIDECVEARGGSGRIRSICSGPDALNRTVQNCFSRLVARGIDADIEVHKYGW